MILFDTTKTGAAAHRSGLTRVSARLRQSLPEITEVVWRDGRCRPATRGDAVAPRADDWWFTTEVFSLDERPGFDAFLDARPCRLGAVFHDAIPLKHPHITWPQSVARHPAYLKMLARFDRIWAVSHASREELLGFWRWQGLEQTPPVDVLALGADFNDRPRVAIAPPRVGLGGPPGRPQFLCVGIVEPRKNQSFLLQVCEQLWREGLAFDLHLVGRVNPHFGAPIVRQIKAVRARHGAHLQFHEAARDETVAALYGAARATLFPTIAEGCGLPLLESLWLGVPCVHSDLPVLRENGAAGGCVAVPVNDLAAWAAALRRILTDETAYSRLRDEATARPLPTWREAADTLASAFSARA